MCPENREVKFLCWGTEHRGNRQALFWPQFPSSRQCVRRRIISLAPYFSLPFFPLLSSRMQPHHCHSSPKLFSMRRKFKICIILLDLWKRVNWKFQPRIILLFYFFPSFYQSFPPLHSLFLPSIISTYCFVQTPSLCVKFMFRLPSNSSCRYIFLFSVSTVIQFILHINFLFFISVNYSLTVFINFIFVKWLFTCILFYPHFALPLPYPCRSTST